MRPWLGRASLSFLVAAAAITASVHACKQPTQVTVDIRTLGFKCQELEKVTVVVASDPEAAEGRWQYPQAEVGSCQGDYEVGTLVVTPSGDRGAVMVLASYSEAPCTAPDYVNCIVARRQFSFIENVPLRLPITLEASCKNVPCNALSSCRSGSCVSSQADCADDGTCVAPAEPVVASDGGTIPPPADATIDVPPNDAWMPPSDGAVDTGIDTGIDTGTPSTDAGSDGPTINADSGGSLPGNDCETPGGPVDCYDTGQVCCAYMYLYCGNVAAASDGGSGDGGMPQPAIGCASFGEPAYACTGREHCKAGEYCCATTGRYASACAPGPCEKTLCTTDADCPAGELCKSMFVTAPTPDGGSIHACAP